MSEEIRQQGAKLDLKTCKLPNEKHSRKKSVELAADERKQ